jgi:hypothetical protein
MDINKNDAAYQHEEEKQHDDPESASARRAVEKSLLRKLDALLLPLVSFSYLLAYMVPASQLDKCLSLTTIGPKQHWLCTVDGSGEIPRAQRQSIL